jgi:hypothetical protein
MKRLLLVVSGLLIFLVIGSGFIYPRVVSSPMMVILLVVLGLSAFVLGREWQGDQDD